MAMQTVRKVLFLGPAEEDETLAVATMELTCGCRVTREVRRERLREISEAGYLVDGEEPCPVGHDVPPSVKNKKKFTLIDRALGRS